MTNTVGFRPKLLPPGGRQLERSHRPHLTCLIVSGCITVLICVVFGLTAFNIYSHRFSHSEHRYHMGDEMSLSWASSDLSATFCYEYAVQPMGWTNFYLFPEKAKLDPRKRVHMSFTLTTLPVPIVQSAHYLLVNSTVELSACYDNSTLHPLGRKHDRPPASFLVIVGDNHYGEWQKHHNHRHVKYTVHIPRNATCDDPSSIPSLSLVVPQSSNYHFVLESGDTPVSSDAGGATPTPFSPHLEADNATLTLRGSINKTQLNLTGWQARCNASEDTCKFPLQWGTHPDVVAKIDQDSQNPDAPVSFFTRCEERLFFWVPVFGVLPLAIMVMLWLWCWCLLVRRRDLRSRYRVRETSRAPKRDYGSAEERDPLVVEVSPPEQEQAPETEEQCATIQS